MFDCPICLKNLEHSNTTIIHSFMGKTRFIEFEEHINKSHPEYINKTYTITVTNRPKKVKELVINYD